MAPKPTAAEQKQIRDAILRDLKDGLSINGTDISDDPTKVGDIVSITDIVKVYDVSRPLARAALQRLSGKDVSPPLLERVKQGQYKVVRLPYEKPAVKGPVKGPATGNVSSPSGNRIGGSIRPGDQFTVEESPFGNDLDKGVYFVRLDETGDYALARISFIEIPHV